MKILTEKGKEYADVELSYVGEIAGARANRAAYRNLDAWVARFQQRPAYKAAIARGGPYSYAPSV